MIRRPFFTVLPLLVLYVGTVRAEEDRQLDVAPEGSFTIVVIPDTQHYTGRGTKKTPDSNGPVVNEYFATHTRWIIDNLKRQKIVFVSHVGDIVDKNVAEQWEVAKQCMDALHGRVPYGISVGNHDMKSNGDSTLFQEFFPAARFRQFDWYAGCFEPDRSEPTISGNNANSVQLFSAAGFDFVFLHLECNAPDDVLAWADDVLTRHADRRALVTTHMDLGPVAKPVKTSDYIDAPKGKMTWTKMHGERGNSAVAMWDKCFRKHKNLFLICCGDQSRSTALYERNVGDHGNPVHEMLSDYQSTGSLRLLRFVPSADEIRVVTYDTTLRQLTESIRYVPERERHQFTMKYDLTGR